MLGKESIKVSKSFRLCDNCGEELSYTADCYELDDKILCEKCYDKQAEIIKQNAIYIGDLEVESWE